VSSLLPVTPGGRLLANEAFETQVEQVLRNPADALRACGCARS